MQFLVGVCADRAWGRLWASWKMEQPARGAISHEINLLIGKIHKNETKKLYINSHCYIFYYYQL